MTKNLVTFQLLKSFRDADTKKDLLEWGEYKTINEAKKKLNLPKADDVYSKLMDDYNKAIEGINKFNKNKFEKQQQKKQQTKLNKALTTLQPDVVTKPTKEQRQTAYQNKYKNIFTFKK